MPEVPPVLLLLGARSPYGRSVARALLASGLPLRAVFVPSPSAWERLRARSVARRRHPGGRVGRTLRRWLDVRTPRTIPGGKPVPEPDLDPGISEGELRARCLAAGVVWLEVDEARSETFLSLVHASGAGLLLSAAFPLVLPQSVLDAAEAGAINFHPSLLPRCRGSHPIFWTLASGETEGGVTAHRMRREVDAGPIVAQIPLPLGDDDTYASLYRRAMAASPRLVDEVAAFLREGREAREQDASRATRFPEDGEEDHAIGWGEQVPRQVLALVRTGQAFTWLRGRPLGILQARAHDRPSPAGPPGRVQRITPEAILVQASGGAVEVEEVVWRGRAYGAGLLAAALRLAAGEVLG